MIRTAARHPAFLPLVAVLAVLVTAIVLQGLRTSQQAASLAPAAVRAAATTEVTGEVQRVQLAEEEGRSARVLVRVDGERQPFWITVRAQTRVLVPIEGRRAVGGAVDLAPRQRVRVEVDAALGLTDGAPAASIAIEGSGTRRSFD